jgi:diaminohydroxyphosphoribosylaminopyrimidine deaminase/5-amino-6-(5-phosphoribosylamino)uracil reductase
MKDDNHYMQLAIELAKKGKYFASPNPLVGCVIVKNNEVIASGYHAKFGENHAEINALEKINFDANSCDDCDIYITLEPCSHFGKTPPCVDSVIKANPKRVIIASLDPNPKVSSVAKMQECGIEVITGVLEGEANYLNRGFFKRMQTGLPFITCKVAMSLDGKIALKNGESKWITGEKSRADVQELRAVNQAIISGSGTVLKDNPRLNVRDKNKPSPIKIILDRSGKVVDRSLNIFNENEVIITDKNPQNVLKMLGEKAINYALIEAGSKINTAFLELGLVDELIIYQAPVLIGDGKNAFDFSLKKLADKYQFKVLKSQKIGDDTKIIFKTGKAFVKI